MSMRRNKRGKLMKKHTGCNPVFIELLPVMLAILLGFALAGCDTLENSEPGSSGFTGNSAETGDQTATQSYSTYRISYDGTGISLAELPVGSRIVDLSWQWEFRRGDNYSNENDLGEPAPPGEIKAVTWILVAKDHYAGLDPHVTLLTEELIALYVFDDSSDRRERYDPHDHGGHNHWGKSGTTNAKNGLRPWLNSSGIHSGEGFYNAFPDNFKNSILVTSVPNWDFESSSAYYTEDWVFIPSATEFGDTENLFTCSIGKPYSYFSGTPAIKKATLLGDSKQVYWTRSPHSFNATAVEEECFNGCEDYPATLIGIDEYGEFICIGADYIFAVRPSLNLRASVRVLEITD